MTTYRTDTLGTGYPYCSGCGTYLGTAYRKDGCGACRREDVERRQLTAYRRWLQTDQREGFDAWHRREGQSA
jgi:hypothetical protein